MVSEKVEAFMQAGADVMAGVSISIVHDSFRAAIQANEARLKACG
jgi:hypothetical protein